MAGSRTVFTLVDNGNGTFTFTLLDQLDHGPLNSGAGDAETLALSLAGVFVATDTDGDSVVLNNAVTVTVFNDVPVAIAVASGATMAVDETVPSGDETANPFASLNSNAPLGVATADLVNTTGTLPGADEPLTATTMSLQIVGGSNSGLETTDGTDILLVLNGSGIVEGRVGNASGPVAFAISIDSSGQVTVAQYLALNHPLGGANHNDAVTLSGHLSAVVTVTDFDGDPVSSTPLPIGAAISFHDDGPDASPAVAATVLDDEAQPFGIRMAETGDRRRA